MIANSADGYGGGSYYSTLKNCIVQGNACSQNGGGSFAGTLHNCLLTGNSASSKGGGACDAMLNNCTVCGNSAKYGGGAADDTLNNCIVYYNSANNGANHFESVFKYSCTMPQLSENGNITNAPLFIDLTGGNFHLQSSSPCINVGNNAYVLDPVDLNGNPRIVGGRVDMGAYESSVIPPTPPEFTSCLWLTNAVQLQFSGEIGRVFEVQGSTNLADWVLLAALTNVSGQVLYTDLAVTNHPSRFYRAVQLP